MKIIRFTAENFKRLQLVEITPDGNVVEITGRNGQGKTSVLDAIWVALAGLDHSPVKPIRTGKDEARITLDLGDLVVTRQFREGKASTLRVESKDGAKISSPQAALDKLLSALAFDPLAFSRMDAKQQFNTLRRFVPDYDFDKADALNAADFDKRTGVNRRLKDAEAQANASKPTGAVPPRSDIGELSRQLEEAGQHNTDIETRKANRAKVADEVARHVAENKRIMLQAEAMEKDLALLRAAAVEEWNQAEAKQARLAAAPPLPEPKDTAAIRALIDSAQAINKLADRHDQHLQHVEMVNKLREESTTLTAEIDKRQAAKVAAVAAAKLPVDGLAFGDGFVTMNGEPFSQASDAEQLRASIAMAMAMNPTLRVIRVRDGSLLDDESMRLLAEMASTHDNQVWIERVDGSGKVGFVLEDGFIKKETA